MPNLTALMARTHMADRMGLVLTSGFAAGGSTALQDISAARGDKIVSVLVVKRTFSSYTAGFAANASTPVGGTELSGGVSAGRNDVLESVVSFGTAGTIQKITGSSSLSANRVLIADAATSNQNVRATWSVGNFGGRKVPDGSVSLVATRVKISDIATNGHSLAVRYWKGDQK